MNKFNLTIFIGLVVLLYSCNKITEDSPLKHVNDLPKDLKEISGIAFSNDLIYALEDSGNPNEVIVLDTLGTIKKTITVDNVKNNDWEDLTFDKQGNLYIGDFGNNDNLRQDLAIYKIEKSELQKNTVRTASKISFYYPEQMDFPPHKKELFYDVEAFFEFRNYFYLFTKNRSKGFDGTSFVYKIPNVPGHHPAKLIKKIVTCSDYNTCVITSAAMNPSGNSFVLLSHSKVWIFKNFSSENIVNATMTEMDLGHYSQKEAVCFKNNHELLIADEKVKKIGGNLYALKL